MVLEDKPFYKDSRVILSAFLAGIGLFAWIRTEFLNPNDLKLNKIETDMALIKQEIITIRTNDLEHLKAQIDEFKIEYKDLNEKVTDLDKNVVKLLLILEELTKEP